MSSRGDGREEVENVVEDVEKEDGRYAPLVYGEIQINWSSFSRTTTVTGLEEG